MPRMAFLFLGEDMNDLGLEPVCKKCGYGRNEANVNGFYECGKCLNRWKSSKPSVYQKADEHIIDFGQKKKEDTLSKVMDEMWAAIKFERESTDVKEKYLTTAFKSLSDANANIFRYLVKLEDQIERLEKIIQTKENSQQETHFCGRKYLNDSIK